MDPIVQQEYQLDYLAYQQIYDEEMAKSRKPRPQATMSGAIEHSGPPLDFSFLNLQDVASLRKERPRAGKRKPIEKDEDEEDAKKGEGANGAAGDEKAENADDKTKQKDIVIKNTAVPEINKILANYSVSLNAAKNGVMGSRK